MTSHGPLQPKRHRPEGWEPPPPNPNTGRQEPVSLATSVSFADTQPSTNPHELTNKEARTPHSGAAFSHRQAVTLSQNPGPQS